MIFEQPEETKTRLDKVLELSIRFKNLTEIPTTMVPVFSKIISKILNVTQGVTFSNKFTKLQHAFNSLEKILEKTKPTNKPTTKLPRFKQHLATLEKELPFYIAAFNKGLIHYVTDINEYKTEIEESKTNAPPIEERIPSFIFNTHGVSLLKDKKCPPSEYEESESVIKLLKVTAAPLCMTFGSTASQDKFMPRFCIILDNWYKTLPQPRYNSIFDDPVMTVIMFNYVICAFYKEYKCDIFKNIPTELMSVPSVAKELRGRLNAADAADAIKKTFDDVIKAEIESKKGALFIYPIADAANYRRLFFDETQKTENLYKLLTTRRVRDSEQFKPGRVTIAYPPTDLLPDPPRYRNKIFVVEDTLEAVSLDAICLNSFKFKFRVLGESPDIHVGAGESLFKLLLDWYSLIPTNPPRYEKGKGPYATYLNEIIRLYDEKYAASPSTEFDDGVHRGHDFSRSTSYSSIRIGSYQTITSISLRFKLFLFEKMGASGINMFDMTCGCIDYDENGEEQPIGAEVSLQQLGPTQFSQDSSRYVSFIKREEEDGDEDMTAGGKRIMTASASIKRKKNVTRRRIHRTRRTRNNKTKKYYLRKTRHTLKKKNNSKSMRRRNK